MRLAGYSLGINGLVTLAGLIGQGTRVSFFWGDYWWGNDAMPWGTKFVYVCVADADRRRNKVSLG